MTRKGWLLFTAMSVVWGIPYLFIKIAVRELDPSVVVFARVGIAAAVLLPVAAQRKVLRQMRGHWLVVAALACVQIAGPFLLISYGEQHIASSLTSLLIATDPLLVVLFAIRFDPSERVNGLRLIGLLIGMAGVVVLLGLDVGGDEQRLLGAVLVLLAAAGYAASLSLVGFSSGGLPRVLIAPCGFRLLGMRKGRRPGFGYKATQEEAIASDQRGHNGQDATRKTGFPYGVVTVLWPCAERHASQARRPNC